MLGESHHGGEPVAASRIDTAPAPGTALHPHERPRLPPLGWQVGSAPESPLGLIAKLSSESPGGESPAQGAGRDDAQRAAIIQASHQALYGSEQLPARSQCPPAHTA